MKVLKKSDIRQMFPRRRPDSHKGENGRVVIIGGSLEFFGAPILAGLGALYSGSDLATLVVPECNFDVSRSFYPDFIVRKYGGNHLNLRVFDVLHPLFDHADALVIGPGLTQSQEILHVVLKILEKAKQPVVLDADAIPAILGAKPKSDRPLIITPHAGEFQELIQKNFSTKLSEKDKIEILKKYAQQWNAAILLKGPKDFIISSDFVHENFMNETGNAGMTVGGTGDVLAGLTASLIVQKPFCSENSSECNGVFEAACAAVYINGLAGDILQRQKGFAFSATDVALELPYAIQSFL